MISVTIAIERGTGKLISGNFCRAADCKDISSKKRDMDEGRCFTCG